MSSQVKLKFFGASRAVTGSKYLIDCPGARVLVDCGLFQGAWHLREQNRADWPVEPSTVDALIITHAHLDHSGMIPNFVKGGFKGPIFATAATADLLEPMLLDSAKLQEEDAEYELKKWRQGRRSTPAPEPLYTQDEVPAALALCNPKPYNQRFEVAQGVTCAFRDAGHILGAAELELELECEGRQLKLAFSGDLGSRDRPIIRDPEYISQADYIVMESTYGDRTHPAGVDFTTYFEQLLREAYAHGRHVLIPAFAVGRSQHLLYILNTLVEQGRIPRMPVYLDSPLAQKATAVFARHTDCYDKEALELILKRDMPLDFPGLRMIQSVEESKQLNDISGPAVIIAGSGMCTGGRIVHHLKHHLQHSKDIVVFVGYQAQGTLGRKLVEGATTVKIYGTEIPVKARIETVEALSAHADQPALLDWARHIQGVKGAFITHGEPAPAATLGSLLHRELGWPVAIPDYLDEVVLSPEAVVDYISRRSPEIILAEVKEVAEAKG